eukprot:scaffold2109_cov188-Amphora_coffeaeformis.AAC.5
MENILKGNALEKSFKVPSVVQGMCQDGMIIHDVIQMRCDDNIEAVFVVGIVVVTVEQKDR